MQKAEKQAVGKYKDPPQEGQAEGTTAHQGHRACGFGGAKKIFLTKINGWEEPKWTRWKRMN